MAKMIINGEVYSGSTNYASAITYIKEDGTKSTVQKELDSRPVNNNLLINSNFANPVNQRGYVSGTVASTDIYTIDRWAITSGMKIELNTNGVTLEMTSNDNDGKGWFLQRLEGTNFLNGKTVTYSAKINGVVYSNTVTLNKTSGLQGTMVGDGFNMYMGYAPSLDLYDINIELQKDSSITIEWAKLELGEVATPYVPRLYAEELELCRYFYQSVTTLDLSCYQVGDNVIHFAKEIKPMRVAPTIIVSSDMQLRTALGNVQSGFTFESTFSHISFFNFKAVKVNHALTYSNGPIAYGSVTLDAEL